MFPARPNSIVIGANNTRTQSSNQSTLSLLLISGSSGTIRLVDHSPQAVWFSGDATRLGYVPAGIVFTDVGTGVQITPRVVGQDVLLTVAPWIAWQSPATAGTVAFREAATEVRVHDGRDATHLRGIGLLIAAHLLHPRPRLALSSSSITMTVTPQIVRK